MSGWKKLAAAPAGGAGLDVDEVFSTYVYTGNSGSQTFVNGLDLAGEGGLVWSKGRNVATQHVLVDSERNSGIYAKILNSDNALAEGTEAWSWTFNSNGYSLNSTSSEINDTPNKEYVSWSFRKAPKFFDVVTYTGNGTSGRTVSHNLGAVPGIIIVKCRNVGEAWSVYYGDNTKDLRLDQALSAAATSNWNNTSPTDTNFTLDSSSEVNGSNNTYVAYLFANNNGDGEFGPDADQDIIKCGSFTSGGQTNEEINLGFEAQFVLIKAISSPYNWETYDIIRGMGLSATTDTRGVRLQPNRTNTEDVHDYRVGAWESGFKYSGGGNGTTYTYIAIRRGSLFPPESGTDVFAIDTRYSQNSLPSWQSGFVTDLAISKRTPGSDTYVYDRPRQGLELAANATSIEATAVNRNFDHMDGWGEIQSASSTEYSWMWKRAPNYFDVVAYTGGSPNNKQIAHNLGVVPELIIQKQRSGVSNWSVWAGAVGQDYNGRLNSPNPFNDETGPYYWGSHTATYFSVGYTGYETNVNNTKNIAYLFATLAGISKVGSYTGNGSSQTINCGFTSGARFVLIKKTSSGGANGDWFVWDTARGIVAGNDPHLSLNTTAAEVTSDDSIDPDNSGFIVNQVSATNINVSSASYIFYAVA
jgi:hypothetical protein